MIKKGVGVIADSLFFMAESATRRASLILELTRTLDLLIVAIDGLLVLLNLLLVRLVLLLLFLPLHVITDQCSGA